MLRLVWPLAVILVLLFATSASAEVRYASPAGDATTSTCTAAEPPCSLRRAVETVSAPGDEVVVAPGVYTLNAVVPVNKAIYVHGADGQARPRVVNTVANVFSVSGTGARLAGLQLEAPGSVVSGSGGTVLERLTVLAGAAPSGIAVTLFDQGLLRDSVVHTAATNGVAIRGAGPGVSRVVNVTAVASHAGGVAVFADSPVGGICVPPFTVELHAINLIARGGLYDLSVPGPCSGTQLLTVSHANYRRTKVNQGVPNGRVEEGGGNQDVEPLFAAPASLDYHQLAGSATIDAGVATRNSGTADVDGDPRTLGSAPDIGGDEYVPPPPPAAPADVRAPVASLLTVAPRAVRPARRGASVSQRRARGTRVSYALDEAATVGFRVQRAVKRGRRTRYRTLRGSFTHAGAVGGNSFRFSGRLRGKALKRGSYRLVGTPTDAAGNRGATIRASFRVVR